jgi:murein DD-endopeptidase MepM/ murein hydrolase activator NlpD
MRRHPILNTLRAHKGVDYAAPRGTPIMNVGDGVVSFAGRQSGYGNVVEIEHRDQQKTLYAHLNSIQVSKGQTVEQGAIIGTVGSTGMATGPHLHFEFHVKGEVRDPRQLAERTDTLRLDGEERAQFRSMAAVMRHQLDTANSLSHFRGDAE